MRRLRSCWATSCCGLSLDPGTVLGQRGLELGRVDPPAGPAGELPGVEGCLRLPAAARSLPVGTRSLGDRRDARAGRDPSNPTVVISWPFGTQLREHGEGSTGPSQRVRRPPHRPRRWPGALNDLPGWSVALVFGGLAVATACLVPAIILGYAVKAAARRTASARPAQAAGGLPGSRYRRNGRRRPRRAWTAISDRTARCAGSGRGGSGGRVVNRRGV